MSTHNKPSGPDPSEKSRGIGYENTDVNVSGVVVFVLALGASVAVFFIVCFGMGKLINNQLAKSDGPPTHWKQAEVVGGPRTDMASSPAMQQKQLEQMVDRFPTPRLQTDDGNQDLADMHVREDLLLENYSKVDSQPGKVRIPIERAMELVASGDHKLQSVPSAATAVQMTADATPEATTPLTNGFARTGYEQQTLAAHEQEKLKSNTAEEHASLAPVH